MLRELTIEIIRPGLRIMIMKLADELLDKMLVREDFVDQIIALMKRDEFWSLDKSYKLSLYIEELGEEEGE